MLRYFGNNFWISERNETSPPRRSVGRPRKSGDAAVPDRDLSQTVRKAVSVLQAVSAGEGGSTLTDIARALDVSTTVCHRLLATLDHEQLVGREPSTGRYRLGMRFVELARRAQRQHPISLSTINLMHQLSQETDDVILLMVENRGEALCVDRVEGRAPVIVAGSQIGSRLPLHCGGAPFAILAFSDDAFIDEVLSRPLTKATPRTTIDPTAIRQRIADTRARGFSIGDEDLFKYVGAVGAPFFGPGGHMLGAISVGGIKPRYDATRVLEIGARLRDAAAALSASLREKSSLEGVG